MNLACRQITVMTYRNWIVFRNYLPFFFVFVIFQPFFLLYGMASAFKGGAHTVDYFTSGFLVYAAATASFMGAAYMFYEDLSTQRLNSWLAANLSFRMVLVSNIWWFSLRSTFSTFLVLLAAYATLSGVTGHHLGWVFLLVFLMSITASLWGCAVAAWARSIEYIYLSDTVLYVVFILSGIFLDIKAFPPLLQYMAQTLPTWHAVELIRPLFSGEGIVWQIAGQHLAVLLGQGVLAYCVAMYLLKKRILD